jgi:hypothetical protein
MEIRANKIYLDSNMIELSKKERKSNELKDKKFLLKDLNNFLLQATNI